MQTKIQLVDKIHGLQHVVIVILAMGACIVKRIHNDDRWTRPITLPLLCIRVQGKNNGPK